MPGGVVPHDDDLLLAGVLHGQVDQGLGDGAGVLPVEGHQVDGAVGLVQEADVGLGLAAAVDLQTGGVTSADPRPAHDRLVLDTHLVGAHHHHLGIGPLADDLGTDLAHALVNVRLGRAALVDGLGAVEGQARHVQQEPVGGGRGVLYLEVVVDPGRQMGHVPEPDGQALLRRGPGQYPGHLLALGGGEPGGVEVAGVTGVD